MRIMRLPSASSMWIFVPLMLMSFSFLRQRHRAKTVSVAKVMDSRFLKLNTILVPVRSSSMGAIISGIVGVSAFRRKWNSLLCMSTLSATAKTVLNPIPFSPISKEPVRSCFLVDSPIAVMERTFFFWNPDSL